MKVPHEDATLYFRLMWQLQFFVSRKLRLLPHITKPEAHARVGQAEKFPVRNTLWEHVELIDEFVAANPTGLNAEELALVRDWKGRLAGDFIIERYLKKGTIFITTKEPAQVYLVLALYETFEEILAPYPLPLYATAVLLPWRGRIIYDGMLQPMSLFFGSNIRSSFRETYMRAKQRGEIRETLGPQGEPVQVIKALPQPAPELVATLDGMVATSDKLKAPGQPMLSGSLTVLKASTRLAQAAAQNPDDIDALYSLAMNVAKALNRLRTTLDRAE